VPQPSPPLILDSQGRSATSPWVARLATAASGDIGKRVRIDQRGRTVMLTDPVGLGSSSMTPSYTVRSEQ